MIAKISLSYILRCQYDNCVTSRTFVPPLNLHYVSTNENQKLLTSRGPFKSRILVRGPSKDGKRTRFVVGAPSKDGKRTH